MNVPLLSMMYSMSSTVIIGVLMVIALITGYDEIVHIIVVVVIGFVVSIPVALLLTKKISGLSGDV